MTRLLDGTVCALWPRAVCLVHPGRRPVDVTAMLAAGDPARLFAGLDGELQARLQVLAPDLLAAGAATATDPQLAGRLRDLDASYGGALPGWLASAADRLHGLEAMQARRRILPMGSGPWPTLPLSTLRRAQAVEGLRPGRVLVRRDLDGVSVLLAGGCETWVDEASPALRAWLGDEAAEAVVSLSWADGNAPERVDVVLTAARSLGRVGEELEHAAGRVVDRGHVVLSVPPGGHARTVGLAQSLGWSLVGRTRRHDYPLAPGGFPLDCADDLLLLRRAGTAQSRTNQRPALGAHLALELDGLAAARLQSSGLGELLDTVALYAADVESARQLTHGGSVASWSDDAGNALMVRLDAAALHLVLSLVPADPGLAQAAVCAALHCFGGRRTRVGPPADARPAS